MVGVMYVYYFVHLDEEPEIWVRNRDACREVLSQLASKSLRDEYPSARVGDLLSSLDARPVGNGFSIPFRWDVPQLFRDGLNGELNLQPVRPGLTQLALRASYTSPVRDEPWDAHRRVEAVVKKFLDSIADSP